MIKFFIIILAIYAIADLIDCIISLRKRKQFLVCFNENVKGPEGFIDPKNDLQLLQMSLYMEKMSMEADNTSLEQKQEEISSIIKVLENSAYMKKTNLDEIQKDLEETREELFYTKKHISILKKIKKELPLSSDEILFLNNIRQELKKQTKRMITLDRFYVLTNVIILISICNL